MTCTANSANSANSKLRPMHIIENAPAMIAWAHEVNDTPRDKCKGFVIYKMSGEDQQLLH